MTARKPGRPVRQCECGDTAFVGLTGPWTAIVDAGDVDLLKRGRWTAQVERTGTIYATRTEDGRKRFLHKMVLPIEAPAIVDHENRNGTDCRRRNLRAATRSQNQMNSAGRPAIRKSLFKGVLFKTSHGKWTASITKDKNRKFLGYFDSEEAAAKAYDAQAKLLHGEFASLNFKETPT